MNLKIITITLIHFFLHSLSYAQYSDDEVTIIDNDVSKMIKSYFSFGFDTRAGSDADLYVLMLNAKCNYRLSNKCRILGQWSQSISKEVDTYHRYGVYHPYGENKPAKFSFRDISLGLILSNKEKVKTQSVKVHSKTEEGFFNSKVTTNYYYRVPNVKTRKVFMFNTGALYNIRTQVLNKMGNLYGDRGNGKELLASYSWNNSDSWGLYTTSEIAALKLGVSFTTLHNLKIHTNTYGEITNRKSVEFGVDLLYSFSEFVDRIIVNQNYVVKEEIGFDEAVVIERGSYEIKNANNLSFNKLGWIAYLNWLVYATENIGADLHAKIGYLPGLKGGTYKVKNNLIISLGADLFFTFRREKSFK